MLRLKIEVWGVLNEIIMIITILIVLDKSLPFEETEIYLERTDESTTASKNKEDFFYLKTAPMSKISKRFMPTPSYKSF